MNVCLISREYPPFFGGGIGAYTVRWSRALAGGGHRVVVITVSGDGKESRDRDGGVEVVRLPFIKGVGQAGDWSGPHPNISTPATRAVFETFSPVAVFAMQIAAALPRLVDEFEIDAVEFPETGALGWFALNARRIGAMWADGTGPALVTTLHSPTQWIAEWNRAPLRGRRDIELAWMERESALWADGIVCPSRSLAEWAGREWGVETAEVIPLPLGELEKVARARANGAEVNGTPHGDERRVLFAGRLEPRKGIDTLLSGFERAVADGADLRLALAGEDMWDLAIKGPLGERLLSELSTDARERVRVLGRVEPEALAALREAADIVVVPSPMDNFPNTCMEAMAHGRVVVAARSGGMAEMIEDGQGLLFTPRDAEGCAAALRQAATLDESAASNMARAAAQRMLDMCGNEQVVKQRVAHLERVIRERRERRAATGAKRYIVVNWGGADEGAIERLKAAAAASGAGFGHGWISGPDGKVSVFSTPRRETWELASRGIGPLVVEEQAAKDEAVARLLRPGEGSDRFTAASTREIAMALVEAGYAGVVAPEVITESEMETRPGAVSAAAEAMDGAAARRPL